jgi:hypothetical protein
MIAAATSLLFDKDRTGSGSAFTKKAFCFFDRVSYVPVINMDTTVFVTDIMC